MHVTNSKNILVAKDCSHSKNCLTGVPMSILFMCLLLNHSNGMGALGGKGGGSLRADGGHGCSWTYDIALGIPIDDEMRAFDLYM